MNDPKSKRQLVWLGGLLLLLALSLYYALGGAGAPGVASGGQKAENKAVPSREDVLVFEKSVNKYGRKKEVLLKDLDPQIHIGKLAEFNPGTPSAVRNMFSLSSPAAVPGSKGTKTQPPSTSSSAAASGGPPTGAGNPGRPVPPPVVINLKYLGYKTDQYKKQRQGFFSEGDEVFMASEGEVIAHRYRVLRLQDSSAEIEELTSKTRQQLNMVVQ